jgi:hypothetical protein
MSANTVNGLKIACVNYEPVSAYHNQGWSSERLGRYYNPHDVAEKVYVFANKDHDWNVSSTVTVSGYRSFKNLEQKCKAFDPDIIRCYEAFRPNSDYALLLAMKLGIPSYLSLHDNRVKHHSLLSQFTVITAYTETLAKKVQKELQRKVETQLNGIPSDIFRPESLCKVQLIHESLRLNIGYLRSEEKTPSKISTTQIRATEILSEKIASVAHVIAGPGSEDIPI